MSLIKASCFHLSTGLNPRTQNKDSLEDSVSTSPEPSKNGQLTVGVGSGKEVGRWGGLSMRKQEGALWEQNGLEVHMTLGYQREDSPASLEECDSEEHKKSNRIPMMLLCQSRAGLSLYMPNDGFGENSGRSNKKNWNCLHTCS